MTSDPLPGLPPLFGVVKKINSESDTRKLLDIILETTIQLSNAKRGTLVLFKGDKERARLSRDGRGRDLRPDEMGVATPVLRKSGRRRRVRAARSGDRGRPDRARRPRDREGLSLPEVDQGPADARLLARLFREASDGGSGPGAPREH